MKLAYFTENYMSGGRRLDTFRQMLLTTLAFACDELLLLQTNDYCDQRGRFVSMRARRHCEKALRQFQPDLIVAINGNGLETSLADIAECPVRTWYIDNPHRFVHARAKPAAREHTFCASRTSVAWCRARYGDQQRIEHLPFCTDEALFAPHAADAQPTSLCDVSFVGTLWNPKRVLDICDNVYRTSDGQELFHRVLHDYQQTYEVAPLAELAARSPVYHEYELQTLLDDFLSTRKRLDVLAALADLDLRVIGPGWPGQMLLRSDDFLRRYDCSSVSSPQQLAEVYRSSRVAISIAHHQAQSGFPIRIYDVLGCGTPLVTDRHPELCEMFEEGTTFLGADTPQEASDAVRRLLGDPALRSRLGKAGAEIVRSLHTFQHRVATLLEVAPRTRPADTITVVAERLDPATVIQDSRIAACKVRRHAIARLAASQPVENVMDGTLSQKARRAVSLSCSLAGVWAQVGLLACRSLLPLSSNREAKLKARLRMRKVVELSASCVYAQLEAGYRAREILAEENG